MTIGTRTWQWLRLRNEHGDAKSAEYDKLTFLWNSQAEIPDRLATASVSANLDAALSRPLATVDSGAAARLASHSEILLAMESATAKILSEATEHRQELDRVYLQKEEGLIARYSDERDRELARIKEEKERVDAEFSARAASLDEKQKELDARQKQLDDRNNTHVRREIRASLLELTKELLHWGPMRRKLP